MPQLVTFAFGSIAVYYGLRGILAPASFAKDFGLPLESNREQKQQPPYSPTSFVVTTGGRTAATGLAIAVLGYTGEIRAAGVVIGWCGLSGLVDTVYCYTAGAKGAVIQHSIGTVVLLGLGVWLRTGH